MLDFASMMGIGMSYMVTLGNEAMITVGHALDFLVDDERTRAVAVFMETVRDPEAFARAARRAADRGMAIVVLKAGSSQLAARTAVAHTGALVGDAATIGAVFDDLGVIRVDSIEDMLLTAGAAAHLGRLARPGIGVVSISGGACDIVADRAEELGAPLPALAAPTEAALSEIMPGYGTIQNPLDVTGAAIIDPTIFTRAVTAISEDPSVGVVAVVNGLPWLPQDGPYLPQVFVDAIGAGMQQAAVPCVYVNQVLQPVTDVTRVSMVAGGVPYTIPGLRQMVVALGGVGWWSERSQAMAAERARPVVDVAVPAAEARTGAWSEAAARGLLADAGIPVVPAVLAGSADEAAKAAAEFGGPVALKVCSPQIVHKSDVGGVRLGGRRGRPCRVRGRRRGRREGRRRRARGRARVAHALRRRRAARRRRPRSPLGPDPRGRAGGVFVEVLKDSALAPLPVTPERAERLLRGLRAAAVLDGVRGGPPVDVPALAAVVARIGDLALALGDELESLEVNPLRIDGSTVEALDAVVTWREQS